MLWLNKEKKKKMEFIQNYVPTSKAQLLQVSIYFNKGDIQKAQEMFDYYNKNLNLPDFDPVYPTLMQQVKSSASDFFSFIKENKDDLMQGYQLIQSIIKNKGELPIVSADEPLPSINE